MIPDRRTHRQQKQQQERRRQSRRRRRPPRRRRQQRQHRRLVLRTFGRTSRLTEFRSSNSVRTFSISKSWIETRPERSPSSWSWRRPRRTDSFCGREREIRDSITMSTKDNFWLLQVRLFQQHFKELWLLFFPLSNCNPYNARTVAIVTQLSLGEIQTPDLFHLTPCLVGLFYFSGIFEGSEFEPTISFEFAHEAPSLFFSFIIKNMIFFVCKSLLSVKSVK